MKIPIEVSARHTHLSKEDLEKLFGVGYELKPIKDLSQLGQFAAEETVTIATDKDKIEKVRILGPVRGQTQVEVSKTDARKLGIDPPVKMSGELAGSAGCKMIGPKGEVELKEGVIIAARHIHASPEEARALGVKDGDSIKVKVLHDGPRDISFDDVHVRVSPDFRLAMHIDTDEANAGDIQPGAVGEIIK